mgnify:CR=1 FL=1
MAAAKKNKKDLDILKNITEKLFALMSVDTASEIEEDKENDAFVVKIKETKQSGLIIGSRGRTLNSIQLILGNIYKKQTGQWKRIIVDVSGWREKEKERLIDLAGLTAERATETKEPQYLYNLTSSQRRIIHLYLAENSEIKTESQGEGKERCLIISSKN